MKILIAGAAGQLGRDLHQVLMGDHEILAVDEPDLDIADFQAVQDCVGRFQPEVIVNCAAFTQVDRCETEESRAYQVNALGPRHLALSLADSGGLLVHVSTDYVFDGRKPPPAAYVEEDATAPLSCYGRTKLAGELAVREAAGRYMIVRTAWLYGIHGKNFLKTVLRLALTDPERTLKVVNDQFGSLTWSHRLARQLARLIKARGQGVYHATAEGYCTWFEVAGYFLRHMGVPHWLIPCTTAEYPTPAARPGNSILENRRLKETGLNLMRPWQDDLDEFIARYRNDLLKEVETSIVNFKLC